VIDAVVDADHRRRARAGFREIEAAGQAVGIVAEIDFDRGGRSVSTWIRDLDLDTVGRVPGTGIVGEVARPAPASLPIASIMRCSE